MTCSNRAAKTLEEERDRFQGTRRKSEFALGCFDLKLPPRHRAEGPHQSVGIWGPFGVMGQ